LSRTVLICMNPEKFLIGAWEVCHNVRVPIVPYVSEIALLVSRNQADIYTCDTPHFRGHVRSLRTFFRPSRASLASRFICISRILGAQDAPHTPFPHALVLRSAAHRGACTRFVRTCPFAEPLLMTRAPLCRSYMSTNTIIIITVIVTHAITAARE